MPCDWSLCPRLHRVMSNRARTLFRLAKPQVCRLLRLTCVWPPPWQCALSGTDMDALVGDVDQLVRAFAKLTKAQSVYVKLERVEDNGCSSWHQDSVPLRLITTYRGPCTEWVHPDVSNATLRRKNADAKDAQSLCHHDVALFKGRGPTEHGDALLNHPGIVHRSPRIEGSGVHRVVLVLDIPQPHHLE